MPVKRCPKLSSSLPPSRLCSVWAMPSYSWWELQLEIEVESYFLFADRYLRQPAGGGGGADEEAHEDHHQHVHRQHGRGGHPHVSR